MKLKNNVQTLKHQEICFNPGLSVPYTTFKGLTT